MSNPAGPPSGPVQLPAALRSLAEGRRAVPVWQNELGGITVEIGEGTDRCFAKWAPRGTALDLAAESERLAWALRHAPVPMVLALGSDEEGSWLLTSALPGTNAASPRWRAEPSRAAAAVGAGLRQLHDALPVGSCPFDWSVERRLAAARRSAAAGRLDPGRFSPQHRPLGVRRALLALAEPPPVDRPVVCQGDACVPNTLLDEDGRCCGHVDLGSLGVADRWADLAVASWSCDWNYGPGHGDALLAAYGVRPDADRIAYYRLLWDLGD